MKNIIKKLIRKNILLEMLSYILQNKLLFKYLNASGEGSFDVSTEGLYQRSVEISKQYALHYNGELEGKVLLEIGSGFTFCQMLLMIKQQNLKKVYCYDRFDCLHVNNSRCVTEHGLARYLDRLVYISGKDSELRVIKNGSIDYIVSNTVLQHVSDLDSLFSILSDLLDPENGAMYHKVDLRCMNKFKRYGDLYFHTFSNKTWKLMGDNIGQSNRLLLQDYHKVFDAHNLYFKEYILEEFSNKVLEEASYYLPGNVKLDGYKTASVEFKLFNKL